MVTAVDAVFEQCLHKFRRTAQESGRAHMAGEVESEMGMLTKLVQAQDTLVTHGASGCLQARLGRGWGGGGSTRGREGCRWCAVGL